MTESLSETDTESFGSVLMFAEQLGSRADENLERVVEFLNERAS